jgi:phage terminase Nu1 subunit (DNA packaging protein)
MGSNKTQTAAHIDISTRHLNRLIGDGVLPPMPDGGYDLDAIRVTYLRHLRSVAAGRGGTGEGDLTKARTELAKHQSERMQLKIAILKAEFCKISEADRVITAMFAESNDHLWNVPPEVAREAEGRALSFAELHTIVTKYIARAVENLQPSDAIVKAAEATAEWIRTHGGRL